MEYWDFAIPIGISKLSCDELNLTNEQKERIRYPNYHNLFEKPMASLSITG